MGEARAKDDPLISSVLRCIGQPYTIVLPDNEPSARAAYLIVSHLGNLYCKL